MDTENNVWKQPIPTNLERVFGNDHISRFIYIDCLLHARNETGTITLNGEVMVLNRGECYITIEHSANSLNRDRKTIRTHLKLLTNIYHRLDIRRVRFGFVVTINNYDDVVRMDTKKNIPIDNQRLSDRISDGHKQECKSVKIDKTEQQQEALSKIESQLGTKYTFKDGKPYVYVKGEWILIGNPSAFAKSLPEENTTNHNPIISDPEYQKLLSITDHSSDLWVRISAILLPKLCDRYPVETWENAWKEARKLLSSTGTI